MNNADLYDNYILLGVPAQQREHAEKLVMEHTKYNPEYFEGNTSSFLFELRYVPPFDKAFTELKRIQGTAAEKAGRRDEYRGYIIFDLNQYLSHEEEPYFTIILQFLIDMNDYWKYIFLIDNRNVVVSERIMKKMLGILLSDISVEIIEDKEILSVDNLLEKNFRNFNISFTVQAKEVLRDFFTKEKCSLDVINAFLNEISRYCNHDHMIDMDKVAEYLSNRKTIIRYLLSQEQYNRFLKSIEEKRGTNYDHREEV